jgi:hypothetical protein
VSLGSRLRPTPIWHLASDIHFPAGQGDVPRQILKDIPRPANSASRDD